MKPNCYECQYRGTISGDAHSQCLHPEVTQISNVFESLYDIMTGKQDSAAIKLNIRCSEHGLRNGWFFWPVNFDPVWLENCDGFTAKK